VRAHLRLDEYGHVEEELVQLGDALLELVDVAVALLDVGERALGSGVACTERESRMRGQSDQVR
jgi:hypothetical protein